MFIAAAISVLIFMGVLVWRVSSYSSQAGTIIAISPTSTAPLAPLPQFRSSPDSYAVTLPNATTSDATTTGDLSPLGNQILSQLVNGYVGLQNAGIYSTSTADAVAQSALPLLKSDVSYKTYTPSDLTVDPDTSYRRMLTYRANLRDAFAPLLKNTQPEYEVFAQYVQTGDAKYLVQLESAAKNYRDAAALTAQVVVPEDAAPYHVAILNAMQEFAAMLDALSAHAQDPFAVAGLLQTYNQAEADMLASFNALTVYYKSKSQ